MKLKYIVGVILLAIFSCTAPLTDDQKNADSVLLSQVKEYTLYPDGRMVFKYFHKRLYNTYFAFHRAYGETFVTYNPEFQTLKVNKSETTMRDGKKVKSPANAFNEVLPFSAADAPAYNHLREMVITHVGLEVGAVVELEYEIETKSGFMPFLASCLQFAETSPIQDIKVVVSIPTGTKFNHSMINQPAGLAFKKTTSGKFDTYTWNAKNIPALTHEVLQVAGNADYPTLTFSTIDMEQALRFIAGNANTAFNPDNSFRNIYDTNSKGWALAQSLRDHVTNNMNLYGVQPQDAGFRLRTPDQVWASNGGTEAEKALLLTAMLNNVGLKAGVALAAYPHLLSKEVGCPVVFDRFYVQVEHEGETRTFGLVDDRSGIPGDRVLIPLSGDVSILSFDKPAKPNLKMELNADLKVSADGAIGGAATLAMSEYDAGKGLLEGIARSFYKDLKRPATDTQTIFDVTFEKGFTAKKVDGYYCIDLPQVAQGLASVHFGELPTGRLTRLELPGTYNEQYRVAIKLPQGAKLVSPTGETSVANRLGSFTLKTQVNGDELVVERKVVVNQPIIEVEDYSNLRSIVSVWADRNLNRVIYKVE
jgi:hypothetical protein